MVHEIPATPLASMGVIWALSLSLRGDVGRFQHVHQDYYCSDTKCAVHEDYEYATDDVHQHEDADVVEAYLADLVMGDSTDDEEDEEAYEDDGDDTILNYCTDTDANGNGDDDDDEDDDL